VPALVHRITPKGDLYTWVVMCVNTLRIVGAFFPSLGGFFPRVLYIRHHSRAILSFYCNSLLSAAVCYLHLLQAVCVSPYNPNSNRDRGVTFVTTTVMDLVRWKSSREFYWLYRWHMDSSIHIIWRYFDTGHGKGEHDDGGACKACSTMP